MSMEDVGQDPDASWRAVTNPILQRTAFGLIIIFQLLTGLAFLGAAFAMGKCAAATRARFRRAKALVPVGISLGFLVWFFGFVVIGGEWFQMWRSDGWNGQPAAFFYYATMLLVGIYVLLENDGEVSTQL
jgi:predicted small integral membrane protein